MSSQPRILILSAMLTRPVECCAYDHLLITRRFVVVAIPFDKGACCELPCVLHGKRLFWWLSLFFKKNVRTRPWFLRPGGLASGERP